MKLIPDLQLLFSFIIHNLHYDIQQCAKEHIIPAHCWVVPINVFYGVTLNLNLMYFLEGLSHECFVECQVTWYFVPETTSNELFVHLTGTSHSGWKEFQPVWSRFLTAGRWAQNSKCIWTTRITGCLFAKWQVFCITRQYQTCIFLQIRYESCAPDCHRVVLLYCLALLINGTYLKNHVISYPTTSSRGKT